MSVVTNLLLYVTDPWKDAVRLAELDDFFKFTYRRALVSIHDETLPSLWYGGNKAFEAELRVGALNHLDLEAFVEHLRGIDWASGVVQLILREQEDDHFRVVTVQERTPLAPHAGGKLHVILARRAPGESAVLVLAKQEDFCAAQFYLVKSQQVGDRWFACSAEIHVYGEARPYFESVEREVGVEDEGAFLLYPQDEPREVAPGEVFVGIEGSHDEDVYLDLAALDGPCVYGHEGTCKRSEASMRGGYLIEDTSWSHLFGRAEFADDWSLEQVVSECMKEWEPYSGQPGYRAAEHTLQDVPERNGYVLWTVRQRFFEDGGEVSDEGLAAPEHVLVGWSIQEMSLPDGHGWLYTPYSERGASDHLGFACPLEYLDVVKEPEDKEARSWRRQVRYHWSRSKGRAPASNW